MNAPSLERINFQHKSSLATKLIEICQAAIDEFKTTRTMNGSTVVLADNARIGRTTRTFKKTYVPKLIALFKEELNLDTSIYPLEGACYLNAATYTEYKAYSKGDDWLTILTGHNLFSGTQQYDSKNYDLDYFKKYSDEVDLEAGKLKTFTTDHLTHLWIFTSMFMSEEIVDPIKVSPITAEEVAAVILHELGHALTILEHMGDVYNRSELATNTVKYLNEKADDKALTETVTQLQTDTEVKSKEFEEATSLLGRVKGKILNFAPVIAIIVGMYLALYIVQTAFLRITLSGQFGSINTKFKKTSDTVVTESNASYVERIADEFVSRQGLGAALAEALAKSIKYHETGTQFDSFSDSVNAIGFVQTTLLSYKIVLDFLSPLFYADDGTYDPDWLRLEHILANSMVVFKDENLDDETRNYFLKETKRLIDVVEKFKNRKTFKIKQLIWGTIFRILSRSSVSDSFSTAGLSADYDSLQLLTNGLIKNRLLYQAARLKSI